MCIHVYMHLHFDLWWQKWHNMLIIFSLGNLQRCCVTGHPHSQYLAGSFPWNFPWDPLNWQAFYFIKTSESQRKMEQDGSFREGKGTTSYEFEYINHPPGKITCSGEDEHTNKIPYFLVTFSFTIFNFLFTYSLCLPRHSSASHIFAHSLVSSLCPCYLP